MILRDGHIEDCEDGEREGRKEGQPQVGSELSMVPRTGVRGGDDG